MLQMALKICVSSAMIYIGKCRKGVVYREMPEAEKAAIKKRV